jgi:hypothetical protein
MRMVRYKSKFCFVVKGIFLKTKDTAFNEHGAVISGSLLDIVPVNNSLEVHIRSQGTISEDSSFMCPLHCH